MVMEVEMSTKVKLSREERDRVRFSRSLDKGRRHNAKWAVETFDWLLGMERDDQNRWQPSIFQTFEQIGITLADYAFEQDLSDADEERIRQAFKRWRKACRKAGIPYLGSRG